MQQIYLQIHRMGSVCKFRNMPVMQYDMNEFAFYMPAQVIFGRGKVSEVGKEAQKLGLGTISDHTR